MGTGMGYKDVLGNDSTEPRPLHDDIPLRLPTHVRNLLPNMLPFPIAIRPYHEHVCRPALIHEIPLDRFGVWRYLGLNWRIEKCEWIARVPFAVVFAKVMGSEMARNGGDGVGGVGLRVIKIEILDILVRRWTLQIDTV